MNKSWPDPNEGTLLALESELALSSAQPELKGRLPAVAFGIIQALQQQTPCVPFVEGNPSPPGVLLASGNRIYIDANNFVENATPEARCPEEVLAYQRAGERHLLAALPVALKNSGQAPDSAYLLRCVTDYAGNFCGCHINVLARRLGPSDIVPYMLPFLVTRFYACAGGWGPTGFVMSQKGRAIHTAASLDTRDKRAIVHLKDESLSASGYKRIHLTSSDATMSELGTYLTVGCTALVLRMLDDGVCVGPAMTLLDPVDALHRLDSDLTWNRPLALKCGVHVSALDIQEHYLRAAETYISHDCEAWMKNVVVLWRQVLDDLRHAPQQLTRKLDPFIKLRLYANALSAHGLSMQEFTKWCGVVEQIAPHVGSASLPRRGVREFLRERLPFVPFLFLEQRLERKGLSWGYIPRAFTVWHAMRAMDLAYHRVDEQGLHWRLRASGAIDSKMIDEAAVGRAMKEAPRGTRAHPRELAIRELLASEKGTANWCAVQSAQRRMNLLDPFAQEACWEPITPPKPDPTSRIAGRR